LISGFCKKNLASVEVWLIKFSRRDMVVRQMWKKISTLALQDSYLVPCVYCSFGGIQCDSWQWNSDVNKATTPKAKAKAKATYLKVKNTTTFSQHIYRTINILRTSEVIFSLQSSLQISQCSVSIITLKT